MHRNLKVALGGAALTAGVVVGLPTAAFAGSVDCTNAEIAAKYAAVCVPAPGAVGDNVTSPGAGGSVGGGSVSAGRGGVGSLPFTGDEILVMTLAGAGALAVGSALTVAGRRRGAATA
jgi:hypothetical protein